MMAEEMVVAAIIEPSASLSVLGIVSVRPCILVLIPDEQSYDENGLILIEPRPDHSKSLSATH